MEEKRFANLYGFSGRLNGRIFETNQNNFKLLKECLSLTNNAWLLAILWFKTKKENKEWMDQFWQMKTCARGIIVKNVKCLSHYEIIDVNIQLSVNVTSVL